MVVLFFFFTFITSLLKNNYYREEEGRKWRLYVHMHFVWQRNIYVSTELSRWLPKVPYKFNYSVILWHCWNASRRRDTSWDIYSWGTGRKLIGLWRKCSRIKIWFYFFLNLHLYKLNFSRNKVLHFYFKITCRRSSYTCGIRAARWCQLYILLNTTVDTDTKFTLKM